MKNQRCEINQGNKKNKREKKIYGIKRTTKRLKIFGQKNNKINPKSVCKIKNTKDIRFEIIKQK